MKINYNQIKPACKNFWSQLVSFWWEEHDNLKQVCPNRVWGVANETNNYKPLKNIIFVFVLLPALLMCCCNNGKEKESREQLVSRVIALYEKQTDYLLSQISTSTPSLLPRSWNKDGAFRLVSKEDWTSGFFPGTLWYLYEATKNEKWRRVAEKFTNSLDSAQFITWNHDVGFMIQNSFGLGYKFTGNEKYKEITIQGAKSLLTRFRPNAGIIQSWDTDAPWIAGRGWDMPVIIDNMMNLNILFKASVLTGDSAFAAAAIKHASRTMVNQYRKDFSCFHLVDYDHLTGQVRSRGNFQGYSDSSSWARGQAWGLYGFVEAYRESGRREFLAQAINIASYIMRRNPRPHQIIPYWDYDIPHTNTALKDASAAAITASALFDLALYVPKDETEMLAYAETIIRILSSNEYLAQPGENGGFILKHSVGNFHEKNENDVPLNYADYYYIEALLKWQNYRFLK